MDLVRLERQLEEDVVKAGVFGAGTLAASASKTAAIFARPRPTSANMEEEARSKIYFGKPRGLVQQCDIHFKEGRTDGTDAVKTPGTTELN